MLHRKQRTRIDMPYPSAQAYNPPVSKTPILGSSSGNPRAFQDPNSIASIGNKIQSISDQAKADTLYDAAPPKKEGFRNQDYDTVCGILIILGITGILVSFTMKR